MATDEEIDTWMTDSIVCPYCGLKFGNSSEYDGDSGKIITCDCGQFFRLHVEFDVSYITEKLPE